MLISLKMSKWRKHLDKTITFTPGLNAVRGANENGKTSMLMAIVYALWGIKALPLPLSEMVTWGHNEKEAGVELVLQAGGELYAFKRSKSGAECNHSGGVVTGQDEVSSFASKLLGADAKMANSLMFAPQAGMRGALEAGPTEIAQYIEGMAGMDLFDTLMELISENWVTGPTIKLDSQVAELESKIEAGGPVEPDYTECNLAIDRETVALTAQEVILTTAQQAAVEANNAYTETKAKANHRESAVATLQSYQEGQNRRLRTREGEIAVADQTVDTARIEQLEVLVRDAMALEATKRAHTAFSKLVVPETTWDGDEASLKAEIRSVSGSLKDLVQQKSSLEADIRVLQGQIVTASVCGFCQQDFSQFPEVAKKNAQITEQTTLKQDELRTVTALWVEKGEEADALQEVAHSSDPFHAFLLQHSQYVEADMNHVPPVLTWKGDPPQGDANAASLKGELEALKATQARVQAAKTRLVQLEQDIVDGEAMLERLKAAVPPDVDLTELQQRKVAADAAQADAQRKVQQLRNAIQQLETSKAQKLAQHNIEKRNFAQLSVTLAEVKVQRDELVANNLIQKKVKAARPTIASELWGMVLLSASVMFSNMRGEQSVITKEPKDFLVNGKTYKGLSGSAMDLMAYAIRVALLKTFLPDCSFMVMDEATAACDESRTMSLFGFIASAGFEQTLLVTHDPAAESVADSVIMI